MEACCAGVPVAFDPAALAEFHFRGAKLFDKRRTDRLVRTAELMMSHPGGTLPQKLGGRAELVGMYRLANCNRVSHQRVLAPHRARTLEAMAAHEGVVLIVHDTTELDFTGIEAMADQLGQIGQGHCRGYLCHNSLAIGLLPGGGRRVLGLAGQVLHKRREVPKGETPKQKREHPDRESRLWLQGCEQVGLAPQGKLWVDICDRGADIFEFLSREIEARRHFVARSAKDRNLAGEDHVGADRVYQKLFGYVRDLPDLGQRLVQVARPGQEGPHRPCADGGRGGDDPAAGAGPGRLPAQAAGTVGDPRGGDRPPGRLPAAGVDPADRSAGRHRRAGRPEDRLV